MLDTKLEIQSLTVTKKGKEKKKISKRVKSNIYYMGSDSSSICLGKRDFTIYFDLVECV